MALFFSRQRKKKKKLACRSDYICYILCSQCSVMKIDRERDRSHCKQRLKRRHNSWIMNKRRDSRSVKQFYIREFRCWKIRRRLLFTIVVCVCVSVCIKVDIYIIPCFESQVVKDPEIFGPLEYYLTQWMYYGQDYIYTPIAYVK